MDRESLDHRRIESAVREMASRMRFCVSGELRVLVVKAMWDYLDRARTPRSPNFTIDSWTMPDHKLLDRRSCRR